MATEQHPLKPYLPENARILMLGSFPPSRKRWCMPFFYPNFQNDMWRIVGLCFFADKNRFVDPDSKTFLQSDIEQFLHHVGIALYDTASEVVRQRNTASDKDLLVVTPTDLDALLERIPLCEAIVTTGQLATDLASTYFGICEQPRVGDCVSFVRNGRNLRFYRMPSSSRAYPLGLEKKAESYQKMFEKEIINKSKL